MIRPFLRYCVIWMVVGDEQGGEDERTRVGEGGGRREVRRQEGGLDGALGDQMNWDRGALEKRGLA